MTVDRIAERLESMQVRGTCVVEQAVVVTRWGRDAFEISTWGRRAPVTLEEAACEVASLLDGATGQERAA